MFQTAAGAGDEHFGFMRGRSTFQNGPVKARTLNYLEMCEEI